MESTRISSRKKELEPTEYWPSWIVLTELQGTSSGGPLVTNWPRHWGEQLTSSQISGSAYSLQTTVSSGPDEIMSFWMERPGHAVLMRALGCAIVMLMPDKGIGEALVGLKEMLDYYTHSTILQLQPLPISKTFGVVDTIVDRPDMVIDE